MNEMNIQNLTVDGFKEYIKGECFTVEFFKLPATPEELAAGRGEYRKLNARLKVKCYVKGTQPETTAKRKATNESKLQIGCYEMRGTSDRVEEGTPDEETFQAKNYRTIPLSADRLISLTCRGVKHVNEILTRPPFFS